jgi:hypothetical protein
LLYYPLLAAVLLQGLTGAGGGIALVADPSGTLLGMPLSSLAGSPFADYFLPGLVLLVVLGIFPLLVSWGLWKRQPWAWYGGAVVGIGLIIWIFVQVAIIGYGDDPPLQAIYGVLGMMILGLTLSKPVRVHLLKPRGAE